MSVDAKIKEVEKVEKSLVKGIGMITAIVLAISALVGAYFELKSKIQYKDKETDFVLNGIIADYNKRIVRLETFLEIAMENGAFENLSHNDFVKMRLRVSKKAQPLTIINPEPFGEEPKDPVKLEDENVAVNILKDNKKKIKLKSLKDYKHDFKQSQQTQNTTPPF